MSPPATTIIIRICSSSIISRRTHWIHLPQTPPYHRRHRRPQSALPQVRPASFWQVAVDRLPPHWPATTQSGLPLALLLLA